MKYNAGKKELYFILIRQIIYLCIFIAASIGFIISIANTVNVFSLFILPMICIFSFFLVLHGLTLACKIYTYQGKKIIIYAGHWNYYIKVDSIVLDRHKNFTKWFTIYLYGKYKKDIFEAKITNLGKITLKINNQVYNK